MSHFHQFPQASFDFWVPNVDLIVESPSLADLVQRSYKIIIDDNAKDGGPEED